MKLGGLVQSRQVIVTCGAGGVGKTTSSAAMALAAARCGRRALVLTIDPARRLAQALGIPPTGSTPVHIDASILGKVGITLPPGGELHAWMLDPRVVLESVVDRFAPNPEMATKIRKTKLYGALSEVMAGLQEYTAAEALYEFVETGRYDLIVLDTPPSRNALDFLDAPRRLTRFLDERTLSMFAPAEQQASAIVRAASKVVMGALSKAFGETFTHDLQEFLGAFGTLFGKMRIHAEGVRNLLRSDKSVFIVLASPELGAVEEAMFFQRRIAELGLVSRGFVLNRSYATDRDLAKPADLVAGAPSKDVARALAKLGPLATIEAARAEEHRLVLARLETASKSGGGDGAMALPYLDQAIDDLPALEALSTTILANV